VDGDAIKSSCFQIFMETQQMGTCAALQNKVSH